MGRDILILIIDAAVAGEQSFDQVWLFAFFQEGFKTETGIGLI